MLFSIETHITCDFPGESGPPIPPLDPHMIVEPIKWGMKSYVLGAYTFQYFLLKHMCWVFKHPAHVL